MEAELLKTLSSCSGQRHTGSSHLQRTGVGGLTTFQRSLTMQFGGRMSACSDVPFMLPLSWRPGTRHCICQPDRTRAAPSLKEPFICGEDKGQTGPVLGRGCSSGTRFLALRQAIHAGQGTGWAGWRAARCSAARTPHHQPTRTDPRTSTREKPTGPTRDNRLHSETSSKLRW